VPRDDQDRSLPPTSFAADAHAAGLQVVPYTFRDENRFLPAELRRGADPNAPGDAAAEYRQFYALGVDGVFSDHPDTAVAARAGR
jgi:glycerophosphoryl diester phosphodiesterase